MGRGRDAQHGIVRLIELRLAIGGRVGGHQRQGVLGGQCQQHGFRFAFAFHAMTFQLYVQPIPKRLGKGGEEVLHTPLFVTQRGPAAAVGAREANQPFRTGEYLGKGYTRIALGLLS